ncbi:MAG: YybH family protein [Flavipsychrobacter sp.]
MRSTVVKSLLGAAYCLVLSFSSFAQAKDEQFIRKMLSAQVTEWNKGNIAGYMKGYWENDSLVFIGKNGPNYGYSNTLARYQKAYPDAAHMGRLTSTIINMKRLSSDYYFIIGKWQLTREAGDIGGSYTLLLHKINGKWVIIVDHSS